ncbi:MAG: peptide chain release factor 1 [Chloroflexi bacterium]|nr:peptide chain release factor 1 [Chloroflexota bacterium]
MIDRLELLEKRYEELTQLMADPQVSSDPTRLQEVARERAGLEDVVTKYREYMVISRSLEQTKEMLDTRLDEEMVNLVREEIASLELRREKLQQELKVALLPKDPNDEKDVIVEIRAGTGGQEAGLFAADLFRMYTRYAQSKGWQTEIIDSSESERGGYKEIIFEVRGRGAFSRLKYERGVHRVQRVPITEASGRIHTSTATVAVLPEAEEKELDIRPEDLKIEFYHSRGAGGQNVNKVATAVRIIHLPTGIMAACQDERSQLKNRAKAMAVLRARILDKEQRERQEELSEERRSQVGTGERAEKIRTYNFPQDRVTDHRIGVTMHGLPRIMDGSIDELIDALSSNEQAKDLEHVYQKVGSRS